jgi:serine/threonine-protein kinase
MTKPCLLAVSTSLVIYAQIARAEPPRVVDGPDPAAAQTLFYEARNLMKAGKFAEACPKLEESLRLDEGIGTRFNLADCEEHLGKTATAWAGFLEVAGKARVARQADRERVARERAAKLEPRLPKLVVDVEGAPPGLEVKRDGVVVGQAQWGTAIPVDPGTHAIVANAPGRQQWETTVETPESRTTRVVVPHDLPAIVVPAPVPAPLPVPPPQTQQQPAPLAEPPPAQTEVTSAPAPYTPPEREERGGFQRTIGWTLAGLGVASLGVSGGFAIVSINKHNDSKTHCNSDVCDDTGAAAREDAIRAGNVATVTAISGGAALGLGIVLVLTAPRDQPPTTLRAVPSFAQGYGGISLQGSLP